MIGLVLGVPDSMADVFTGWVRDVLEFAHDAERRDRARGEVVTYFLGETERRRKIAVAVGDQSEGGSSSSGRLSR